MTRVVNSVTVGVAATRLIRVYKMFDTIIDLDSKDMPDRQNNKAVYVCSVCLWTQGDDETIILAYRLKLITELITFQKLPTC